MAAISPLQEEIEFDHGTFDSAAFTTQTLASWQNLAGVIDHTLLKPDATREQVENLCDEALRYRFACAMVNPIWVPTAVSVLSGTGIPVGVVIGFPLGASLVSSLRHEAAALTRLGARELDMVIPIGQLKSGNHHAVEHAIHATATVAHHHGAMLKVILETCLLTVRRKAAGSRDRDPGRGRLPENLDRLLFRGSHRGRRGSAARRRRRSMWGQGLGRNPYAGRRAHHARSRSQSHRGLRRSGDCAGAGSGIETATSF